MAAIGIASSPVASLPLVSTSALESRCMEGPPCLRLSFALIARVVGLLLVNSLLTQRVSN